MVWQDYGIGRPSVGMSSGYYSQNYGRQQLPAYRRKKQEAAQPKGLAAEYQSAQDRYNEAVAAREQELRKGFSGMRTRALGYLQGVGTQQRADLAERYGGIRAKQNQYLRSRGLAGTTLAPTMALGTQREEEAARNRLEADLKREYLGYDVGLDRERLGMIERIEDTPPDYGQLMALAQMKGQAGGGGYRGGYGMGRGAPTTFRRAGTRTPGAAAGGGGWMPGAGRWPTPAVGGTRDQYTASANAGTRGLPGMLEMQIDPYGGQFDERAEIYKNLGYTR